MSLTAEGLEAVRGLGDPIKLGEVEDIYLPLINVLQPAPPGATRARATLVLHKGCADSEPGHRAPSHLVDGAR